MTRNDAWLSGFADGEGCFSVKRNGKSAFTLCFAIKLRADEKEVLKSIQREFGGSVKSYGVAESTLERRPGTKPSCEWRIRTQTDVLRLIDYFDQYPLQSKKRHEYPIWRQAALLYYRYSVGMGGGLNPEWLIGVMNDYDQELQRLKLYQEEPCDSYARPDNSQLELLG